MSGDCLERFTEPNFIKIIIAVIVAIVFDLQLITLNIFDLIVVIVVVIAVVVIIIMIIIIMIIIVVGGIDMSHSVLLMEQNGQPPHAKSACHRLWIEVP